MIDDLIGNIYLTPKGWKGWLPLGNKPFIVIKPSNYGKALIQLLEEPDFRSVNSQLARGYADIAIESIRQCKLAPVQSIMSIIKHRLIQKGVM